MDTTRWFAMGLATLLLATRLPAAAPAPPTEAPAVTETVKVTATRLSDKPIAIEQVPAHVTVITQQQIARSGARTVQDLLALEAGVVLYDQVGNDIEKTVDLRGFSSGSGTRVFLDGAPINDPRSNALTLELIPVDALERVEITRGPGGAFAGGGSEAGVIRLFTRRGERRGGSFTAATGTFDTTRYSGDLAWKAGGIDLFLAGSQDETDGFKENAEGELRRLAGSAGIDLGGDRRLEISLLSGRSDFGNPGAVAGDEDPDTAPFNGFDYSRQRLGQASLNFRGSLIGSLSFAANAFFRERESEILTTGRQAAKFGSGIFLDSDASIVGSTLQLSHERHTDRMSNELSAGAEWLDGKTDSSLFLTPVATPLPVDPTGLISENTADRRTLALFAHDSFSPWRRFTFTAGARLDDDRVGYVEAVPVAGTTASRDFSELSWRAGVTFVPAERRSLYAAYVESFLPPSAEGLFAFPGFGSNPGLDPEDARSFEVGFRSGLGSLHEIDVALFRTDTSDEIVFDPDSPLGLFGANENAGKTRREGVEASYRGRPLDNFSVFANATLVDAEFQNGEQRGKQVPLVPRERLAVGFDVDLPANFSLRMDALYVGAQVVDNNDETNAQPKLDEYAVVNARMSFSPAWTVREAAEANGGGPLTLFAEARNLLDRDYATRGIYAGQVFVTPAPSRRYLVGATVRY